MRADTSGESLPAATTAAAEPVPDAPALTRPAPDAAPAAAPPSAAPAARPRRFPTAGPRYLLSAIVFTVIAALSVATCLTLRGVVHTQERRLLNERATELAAYLEAATARTSATLAAAGQAVAVYGGDSPLFTQLATPLTANGATIAVAQRSGAGFATVAAVGKEAAVGSPLSDTQQRVVERAAGATGLVFQLAPVGGGNNHYLEGLKVPGRVPTVVLLQGVLPKPTPIPTKKDSPYRELDVALYAGTKPDPRQLVLISGAIPEKSSHPVHVTASIGSDKILVVTAGHSSLVGNFARSVPWIALAGGLLLALVIALLVQVLTRRRAYALKLVEQRTRAMYEAQMAAEAANRSKSEFLSRMSHELRTPLNAVLGFGQLLEMDELTADQEQAVKQITRGGRHLLDLINEILDISQIETGTLALSPEAVPVGELISETVDLIRPLGDERGVHLLGGGASPLCDVFIFADRQRLKQILLNLLGNGIKYNREGGTVSITCARPAPGMLRIQVTDTGPGIPQAQFALLFTPFERLGAEQTTIEGTGIGLALSRRLAEVMGATLGVESTVGRGSTFWIDFPVVEGPVQRGERLGEVGPPAVAAPGAGQPAVLHIEDNLSNIQLIERVLAQRPGVRLIPAMQGRLGLELARQHHPALILLDLNLADVSGEEVLHLLRDDPATAHVPVAIVSADAMPRQVQRLLAGGATAYLTKPIDVRKLLGLVDDALAAHERRAESVAAGRPDPATG